jgi:hypothetical protein
MMEPEYKRQDCNAILQGKWHIRDFRRWHWQKPSKWPAEVWHYTDGICWFEKGRVKAKKYELFPFSRVAPCERCAKLKKESQIIQTWVGLPQPAKSHTQDAKYLSFEFENFLCRTNQQGLIKNLCRSCWMKHNHLDRQARLVIENFQLIGKLKNAKPETN